MLFLVISMLFSTNPDCLMGFSLFSATTQGCLFFTLNLAANGQLNLTGDSAYMLFVRVFITTKQFLFKTHCQA